MLGSPRATEGAGCASACIFSRDVGGCMASRFSAFTTDMRKRVPGSPRAAEGAGCASACISWKGWTTRRGQSVCCSAAEHRQARRIGERRTCEVADGQFHAGGSGRGTELTDTYSKLPSTMIAWPFTEFRAASKRHRPPAYSGRGDFPGIWARGRQSPGYPQQVATFLEGRPLPGAWRGSKVLGGRLAEPGLALL